MFDFGLHDLAFSFGSYVSALEDTPASISAFIAARFWAEFLWSWCGSVCIVHFFRPSWLFFFLLEYMDY
jgi:hypothetical protein